jgi:uncharacterized protein (TIGR02145 family)
LIRINELQAQIEAMKWEEMMNRLLLVMFLVVLFLGVGLVLSCGDDDDGDDSSSGDDAGDNWTDPTSGLTWQMNTLSKRKTWEEAQIYCDSLGGGWHLPTISELRTLIRGCVGTMTGGACGVTDTCRDNYDCLNDSCVSCEFGNGPNKGCYGPSELAGECDCYWSSSVEENFADPSAWIVYFNNGHVDRYLHNDDAHDLLNARCVH